MPYLFKDRQEAGRKLSKQVSQYASNSNAVVLALAKGGVAVASEIARSLNLPLDVLSVRKIAVPGQAGLAMGAVASGGVQVLNRGLINSLHISREQIEQIASSEYHKLEQGEKAYRGNKLPLDVKDKIVILVDDGIATGATIRATVTALKLFKPQKIIVAVPSSSGDAIGDLRLEVDELVCLSTPEPYTSVGRWYKDFHQLSDKEVKTLLEKSDLPPSRNKMQRRTLS